MWTYWMSFQVCNFLFRFEIWESKSCLKRWMIFLPDEELSPFKKTRLYKVSATDFPRKVSHRRFLSWNNRPWVVTGQLLLSLQLFRPGFVILPECLKSTRHSVKFNCLWVGTEEDAFSFCQQEFLTERNVPACPCAICLRHIVGDDDFVKTVCFHYFHSLCFGRYFKNVADTAKDDDSKTETLSCPVCRGQLPEVER